MKFYKTLTQRPKLSRKQLTATALSLSCGLALAGATMYGPFTIPVTESQDGGDSPEYALAIAMYKIQVESKWVGTAANVAKAGQAVKNHDYVRIIYQDKITDFLIKTPFSSAPIVWDGNVPTKDSKHSYYTEHPEEYAGRCPSGSAGDLYVSVPTGYWGQSWPAGEMSTVATWISTGSISIHMGTRQRSCTITA